MAANKGGMGAATAEKSAIEIWAETLTQNNRPDLLDALPSFLKKLDDMKHQASKDPKTQFDVLNPGERDILRLMIIGIMEIESEKDSHHSPSMKFKKMATDLATIISLMSLLKWAF